MHLYNYLVRLESVLRARNDLTIKQLQVFVSPIGAKFSAQVEFMDGSILYVVEEWNVEANSVECIHYAYHYQDQEGNLIFRYDNASHYPEVETYPSHKHVGSKVIAAYRPDLVDLLREIEEILYKE